MKYDEFINSILESRENKWFEYSERHHIIPRCMGGQDIESNLIYLTYEEHFRAHVILSEEYPENSDLQRAVMIMSRNMEIEAEEYAILKKRFSDSQRGNKHYEGKTHSDDWKLNCSKWMQGNQNAAGKRWVHRGQERYMVDINNLDKYLAEGFELGIGKLHTEETKEYCRKVALGRIWINNGVKSKMIYEVDGIPEGWRKGRLIKQDERGRIIGNGDKI